MNNKETSHKEASHIIVTYIVGVILLIALTVLLTTCHQKVNPIQIKTKVDTITQVKYQMDTIKLVRQDTIILEITKTKTEYITIHKDSIVYEKCNDRTERVKARLDYKAERDSLEAVIKLEREKSKQEKYSGQQAVKINKQDNKAKVKETRIENRSRWWLWLLIGIVLGIFIHRKITI
jgi:hypothetical protein